MIHSYDMSKANVHDIHYLQDIKREYSHITVIGDKGYLSASVQLDLFETSEIRLEVPYRSNQKDWQPTFPPFAKARKRVETLFSQMVDQFMLCRNYAKQQVGLFAWIISKDSVHLNLKRWVSTSGRGMRSVGKDGIFYHPHLCSAMYFKILYSQKKFTLQTHISSLIC